MATPELSQEEIEIAEDKNDLPKKGTLGNIALKLSSTTIRPQLTLDKGVRLDESQLIKIKKWANVDDENAPSVVKKLTLSNNSKADMTFNLGVDGSFEIVKTKSNTGAKHALSGQGASKVVNKKVETMFCLQPLKIVELGVKFIAPKPGDRENWPMIMEDSRDG